MKRYALFSSVFFLARHQYRGVLKFDVFNIDNQITMWDDKMTNTTSDEFNMASNEIVDFVSDSS